MLIIIPVVLGVGVYVGVSIDKDDQLLDNPSSSQPDNSSSPTSDAGLTELPKSVLDDKGVKTLNLSGNSLTSLPSEIGELTKIEVLILDDNELEGSLPGEIRKMTNLKTLSAKNNKLTGIPAEIGQLSNLETADFSGNDISGLPLELGNLSNLKTLDLRGNPVSTLDLGKIQISLPSTVIRTD